MARETNHHNHNHNPNHNHNHNHNHKHDHNHDNIKPGRLQSIHYLVDGLHFRTLLGIRPYERIRPQPVSLHLCLSTGRAFDLSDLESLLERILKAVEDRTREGETRATLISQNTSKRELAFKTIESLSRYLADMALQVPSVLSSTITLKKPKALPSASHPSITLTRYPSSLSQDHPSPIPISPSMPSLFSSPIPDHIAYIAIGSNMGDRLVAIHEALDAVRKQFVLVDSSFLYQTKPMYGAGTEDFLNCVLKISTPLDPSALLHALLLIETSIGQRDRIQRYGPRPIDLDLLLHGQRIITTPTLTLPHPRMLERAFVLKPLADISPRLVLPESGMVVQEILEHLSMDGVQQVHPLGRGLLRPMTGQENTLLMGIVNFTHDSFSDGGQFCNLARERVMGDGHERDLDHLEAIKYALRLYEEGADIVDLGGQSTHPMAMPVTMEEEAMRVLPLITGILAQRPQSLLSIDTFHASLADAAIKAGASIINDVSGGRLEPEILKVAAKYNVPIVLVHSKCKVGGDDGEPINNTIHALHTHQDYDPSHGIHSTMQSDLSLQIQNALQAGIARWNIILDPGLGFSKTGQQNVQLYQQVMHQPHSLLRQAYPVLWGPSRKGFIGKLCSLPHQHHPKERDAGTIGALCAAIQCGASIVRVHNVQMANDAIKVFDALLFPLK